MAEIDGRKRRRPPDGYGPAMTAVVIARLPNPRRDAAIPFLSDEFERNPLTARPRQVAALLSKLRNVTRRHSLGISMKSLRPENADPIPLRQSPPGFGTIMIRFIGLLVVAIGVMALIWTR